MNFLSTLSNLFNVERDGDSFVSLSLSSQHPIGHTWNDLRHDVAHLAARLRAHNPKRLLITDDAPYPFSVSLLATLHTGATALLPANLQSDYLAVLASSADGIVGAASMDNVPSIPTFAPLKVDDATAEGMDFRFSPLDPETATIILHTSGTTGAPEAAVKPLRCLEAEIFSLHKIFNNDAESILSTVPPYHMYGLLFRILWPLSIGRPFHERLIRFPSDLLRAVAVAPSPMLISSPAFLRRTLPAIDLTALGNGLHGAFSSGGPLDPTDAAAYNSALKQPLWEVYGSTETGGIGYRAVKLAAGHHPWQKLPNVNVGLAPNTRRLVVSSPHLASDAQFIMGDQGELLPDGKFLLLARNDRVVKLEEKRVSLAEVERLLLGATEVASACMTLLSPDKSGRAGLGAVVVPTEAGWDALAEDGKIAVRDRLMARLRGQLDAVALPRRWRFVKALPENSMGKTVATDLRALFAPDNGDKHAPIASPASHLDGVYTIEMTLQSSLTIFDGHFPTVSIVPGVALTNWAIRHGVRAFSIQGAFHQVQRVKFFSAVPAGATLIMTLQYDATRGRLQFEYMWNDTVIAAGRIFFK